MSTLGYVFILAAILVIRQVSKGRVMNTGEDLADMFLAIVNGDTQGLGAVVTKTGDYAHPDAATIEAGMEPAAGIAGNTILSEAVKLGSAAKGYRWAASGPNYYDCSGLVYRAVQKVGYKGPRFYTSNLASAPGMYPIDKPQPGDIVLWRGVGSGHTGIVSGPDKYYSARSVRSGIGYSSISSLTGKGKPRYFRFATKSESAQRSALTKQNGPA